MTTLSDRQAIGRDLVRREGGLKVTGTAPYADDAEVDSPVFCRLLLSPTARGRVTGIEVPEVPGLLTVLRAGSAEKLTSTGDDELAVLQDTSIAFRGQIIGAVIAETSEAAREAARLARVACTEEPQDTAFSPDRDDLYKPEKVNAGYPTDTAQGDLDAAMRTADVTVERTYTTATYHNNPMEPHSTTALWDGENLLLWESTQGVHPVRETVTEVFGLAPERVRVVSPHVGGGFGSKGAAHANVIVAAMAARALPGRPVRLALTRREMFSLVGYRTRTVMRTRLASSADGVLSGVGMDVVAPTSKVTEFAEQAGVPTRMMYAAPHRATSHRLAALDVPVPTWMRAPGECPGMFGNEVAMDELAEELGVDPIELRVRNEPAVDPASGKPYSSRGLVACLRSGAERFGWSGRRRHRVGDWLVGTGVASSVYPAFRMPHSTAHLRYADGRYVVSIGAADLGTGTWTALAQIAADGLGVPVELVEARIGDTDQPYASVAGGSSGISTWGSAIVEAARAFREKHGTEPPDGAEATGEIGSNPAQGQYAMYAFGAQFAEVHVHADTGEIRVPRLFGMFAAGRIVNPRTARSQLIGGMTMGLSMALHETSVLDPRFGHVVTQDFADYHVATCADAYRVEADWIDEHDRHVNPMGTKGIGEIGIVGTAAAIVNAAHHATGARIRDLPLTLDKLLPHLP